MGPFSQTCSVCRMFQGGSRNRHQQNACGMNKNETPQAGPSTSTLCHSCHVQFRKSLVGSPSGVWARSTGCHVKRSEGMFCVLLLKPRDAPLNRQWHQRSAQQRLLCLHKSLAETILMQAFSKSKTLSRLLLLGFL
ncbi:hypothetical protein BaRGS_00035408 [Batillaria attramentaria]|uniref:Uncharacterized protein n=1 Tax=Batillaria attramentaria TaxID=370345 RepID=A0ABD0JEN5_9CAEN